MSKVEAFPEEPAPSDRPSWTTPAEILESIDDAFYALDRQWRFVYVNGMAERMWGRRREDLLGKSAMTVFPMWVGSASYEAHRKVLETGKPLTVETDSTVLGIPVEVNIYPRSTGLSVYFRDVSARRRTEEALRASEERYRTLIDNANDLVFTLDIDFRITSANPAVKRLLGYEAEELIGVPLGNFVPAKQIAKHEEMLRRKLAGEASETRYEMEVIDRKGGTRTLETASKLSYDRSGKPNGIHAIARDVTERKKFEEHLALTTRELSHRTKNVLAVVQAMVHQLGKQTSSFPEFERRLAGCVTALAHCHDLLVDSDWKGADLRDLLLRQLAPFGLDENRIVAMGPPISLGPQATQLIGLAFHELATNAAKHGALTTPTGIIAIEWQYVDPGGAIQLVWREQNGPPVSPPTRHGFGHTVLQRMAASLDGKVSLEFLPEGVRWSLLVDAAHIVRN